MYATAAVAIVLALAGLALVALLRTTLTTGIDASVRTRADEIAALVQAGTLATVVPAAQDEGSVVQVLDGTGAVIAATGNIQGEPALVAPSVGGALHTAAGLPIGAGDRFRVLTTQVGTDTVVVAQSLGPADRAVASAGTLLLEVLPVVLALVALITWLGVGRALAPLEQIRRRTATIGAGEVTAQVPLPRTRDEVYRLAQTMNAMLERIGEASARQRRFVADASHELRSPLATMQAVLEVAQGRDELAMWTVAGTELQAEQVRMRRLVEDLLLLARLDGNAPVVRHEVDLDDLVHEAADALRRTGTVQVAVDPLPALRVRGDRAQLARVLQNLTDNAQRHATSTVHLALLRRGDRAVVQVRDDGPGVAPVDRERIFERFTRLDEARARDRGGSGLGLAISREIARSHGGSLQVLDGEAGTGAVFEVDLPLWNG
jgi:signal transduction histidine kinase